MTVIDDYMEVCALICVFIVFANLLNLCIKLYWHALLQMAAAWGGYVFVLNMIGIHAALLVILGRFTTKVYLAYTLFYVIGTSLAVQVPVVGWAPLRSLEQLPACAVFLGYQLLQFCEVRIRKQKMSKKDAWKSIPASLPGWSREGKGGKGGESG